MADENPTVDETPEEEPPVAPEEAPTDGEMADEEYRQNRRLDGPGVEGYDPETDPLLPNSVLREAVQHELTLSEGKSSPTWDALYEAWCMANPEQEEQES